VPFAFVPIIGTGTDEDPFRPDTGLLHPRRVSLTSFPVELRERHPRRGYPLTPLARVWVDDRFFPILDTAIRPDPLSLVLAPVATLQRPPRRRRLHGPQVEQYFRRAADALRLPSGAITPEDRRILALAVFRARRRGLRRTDARRIITALDLPDVPPPD